MLVGAGVADRVEADRIAVECSLARQVRDNELGECKGERGHIFLLPPKSAARFARWHSDDQAAFCGQGASGG